LQHDETEIQYIAHCRHGDNDFRIVRIDKIMDDVFGYSDAYIGGGVLLG
jgi:hypothetical protein